VASATADPAVKFADRNHRRRLPDLAPAAAPPALGFALTQAGQAPNDPLYERQWHLARAKFPEAWARTTGEGVIVAVIDSGVDPDHPDLRDHLLPLVDEVVALGGHDDIGETRYDGRDGNGHGTHVCGLVGALRGNGIGVVGGAPDCRILPVKVTANDGETDDATIARGITDAVEKGARVLNLSIGGPDPSSLLLDALNGAFARNATVCIASGNDGGLVNYPAAYAGVVAVGGFTSLDGVASYSSRGADLVVVAPGGGPPHGEEGDQILSTLPTYDCRLTLSGGKPKDYGGQAGTSMASPLVSALAALVIAENPAMSGAQVRTRLAATCDDLGPPGFDEASGWGLVNAERATR
jgi:subtilisin family serine protease